MAEGVTGLSSVIGNLDKTLKKFQTRIVEAVSKTQWAIVNDAQIRVPKVTRNLMWSIAPGPIMFQGFIVSGKVWALAEYAAVVEQGRPDQPKRKVTPYLKPAMEAQEKYFIEMLQKAITV